MPQAMRGVHAVSDTMIRMITRRSFATMIAATPLAAAKTSKQYLVYFGTYTRKNSKGIYCAKLDAATGKVSEPELAGEISNPSFVAIHPSLKNLYAVTEMGARGEGGTVT